MTNGQKKRLETQLWNIADSLRGKMNADEFRDYCLGFIFYKYLSERQHLYANEILEEDELDYVDLDEEEDQDYLEAIKEESIEQLGYFLKPSELFASLAYRALGDKEEEEVSDEDLETSSIFILDDLTQVLNSIERSTMGKESEDDFDHLFEDLDLTSTKLGRTPKAKNALIAKILVHLNKIDFRLEDSESDVLGDAYEYLIGQFASGAGKKAGEFYTPQQVSKVLAKIVTTGKQRLKSVYDPTCGSGSLLLRVAREVDEVGDYYGQEMNRTTYNLARMNMILHGVHYRNFDLRQEDTLEHPQHEGMRFEAVVANPPFSAKWSANKLFESDDRFSQYGRLVPGSKADFAFVQHMLHHLDENGTMAVVLPHGVLFRGGAEDHIRQYLIKERNWLDAVIGLPENIFYGTSIATCILVLKKCREQSEDVLFVNASAYFEKAKNQNYLRNADVEKIISTYRGRLEESRYSHRANLAEIEENDFNLNISRYVDTFEEEEEIDLEQVSTALAQAQESLQIADKRINKLCSELEIFEPKGCNVDLLQIYKQGVMQKIFSKKKRFRDAIGADFPDWQKRELGDICDYLNGKPYEESIVEVGRYDLITLNSVDIDGKLKSVHKKIDFTDNSLEEGDLVIVLTDISYGNLLGRTNIIPNNYYVLNQRMGGLKPKIKVDAYFLMNYINYNQRYFKLHGQGARQKNLSKGDILCFSISFPTLEEQEKIADFLKAIDQKIDAISMKIDLTKQF